MTASNRRSAAVAALGATGLLALGVTPSFAQNIPESARILVGYPSMIHDFHVSRNYIAFTICPMVCDWEGVKKGEPFLHWDSTKKTMVGIIPGKQGVKAIRWYTCPKVAMQTHTFNAWEEGSVVNLDHFVTGSGWLSQFPDLHDPEAKEKPPFGERWSFDLASPKDGFGIKRLNNHMGEMPVIDPRFAMKRTNHFYFGTFNPTLGPMLPLASKGPPFTCLGHFDEAKDNPNFFVSLSATSNGKFLPQTGAVLIKDAMGAVLGAVGASGGTGDEDEAICMAGVAAAGLVSG